MSSKEVLLEDQFLAVPKRKNWLARSWEQFKYTACYQGIHEGFVGGITFGFVLGTLILVASQREIMRVGYKHPIVAGQKVKRPVLLQIRGYTGALALIASGFGVLFAFGGAIQGCSVAGISEQEIVQRDLEKLENDIALMANKGVRPPKAEKKEKQVEKFDPVRLEGLDPKIVALSDVAKRQADLRAARIEQERRKAEALQQGRRPEPVAAPVQQASGWWPWK